MGMRFLLLFLSLPVFAEEVIEELDKKLITDVYVVDFMSDNEKDLSCDSSSVDLTHRDAKFFFTERAQQVTHKTLHDYFYWSPCYMVGNLKYAGKTCSWRVYASGIGSISCKEQQVWYFACDDGCDDLLRKSGSSQSCDCNCNQQKE
jgi:hypothetical protein